MFVGFWGDIFSAFSWYEKWLFNGFLFPSVYKFSNSPYLLWYGEDHIYTKKYSHTFSLFIRGPCLCRFLFVWWTNNWTLALDTNKSQKMQFLFNILLSTHYFHFSLKNGETSANRNWEFHGSFLSFTQKEDN